MLGQHGRGLTKALLTRPALAMARAGITPDMLTVAGTVLTVGVAVATLPQGRFLAGPPLLGLALVGDSLDGILARATGRSSVFGAFPYHLICSGPKESATGFTFQLMTLSTIFVGVLRMND